MNLRLHDPHRTAKLPGHRLRLLRRVRHSATRHRYPVALQQALRLVLMDVHPCSIPSQDPSRARLVGVNDAASITTASSVPPKAAYHSTFGQKGHNGKGP